MEKGDKLLFASGKYGTIISVKNDVLNEPLSVYNFEVEGFHTYYVGKKGICTHNAKCGGSNYKNNPLDNVSYSEKVYRDIVRGDNHSFPFEVDNFGALGKLSTLQGNDGKIYIRLTIDGANRGRIGYFEYIGTNKMYVIIDFS